MITFTFTYNPVTNEYVTSGNISSKDAIYVLQNILVEDEIKRRKEIIDEARKAEQSGGQEEHKTDGCAEETATTNS